MFAQICAAQGGHALGALYFGEDNSGGTQHFKVMRARRLGDFESNFIASQRTTLGRK